MPNLIKIKSRSNLAEGDIPVITMTPLWSEPMETTFNTVTTILETLSGKESRTARLYRPLVGADYVGIAADQAEHLLYKDIFSAWKDSGMFAIPLWMDAVQLDADITTTPISYFFANGFNRLFRWFRYALLWESPEHCEVIEIKRIGKSGSGNKQIVCRGSSPVSNTYHAGAFLVPLAIGTIAQPDREFLCNTVNTIQISFNEKQGAILHDNYNTTTQTHDESDSLSYYLSYTPRFGNEGTADNENVTYPEEIIPANYEKFDLMPNWDLSENIYSDQDDVYFDTIDGGAAKPYIINDKNKLRISLGYTLDREGLQYLLNFFEHHDGAKGEFWVPTWTADCVYDGNTLNNVFVVRKDLSVWFYEALTNQESAGDINFICKAVKCRFAEDTLEITATTNNLYQVVCSFVQCECAYPVTDTQSKTIYLYELTKQGGSTNRYANYGYGVTVNGNYYTAADIAYTEIVKDVEALDNKIEVSCSGLDGVLALNMRVEIKKGEIAADGAISGLTSIFKGIVTRLSTESNGVRLMTVESNLYTFDNDVPRIKLQRQCNWQFGDSQCGIINVKNILKKYVDGNKYYLCVPGDSIDYSKATRFQKGFTSDGNSYEIAGLTRVNDPELGVPGVYKFPITLWNTGSASNVLLNNTAYSFFNKTVEINGVIFGFGTCPDAGYNYLGIVGDALANDAPTIEIDGTIHYLDFIWKTFTQQPTYSGYTHEAIPLTFKVGYFARYDNNPKHFKMSCFYYAPAYVGNKDAKTLYLPMPGSTVTMNIGTAQSPNYIELVIKEYIAGDYYNYVVFEDDANLASVKSVVDVLGSTAHISIFESGKELGWGLFKYSNQVVPVEYNGMQIEVSASTYNALSVGSQIKLRRYCNKQISCCKECYNNVARFGGFPWLPNNTPYEYTQSTSSGKK